MRKPLTAEQKAVRIERQRNKRQSDPEAQAKAREACRKSMERRRVEKPGAYWFYNLSKRAIDGGHEFDLTLEFLEALLAPMVCSVTKLPLQHTARVREKALERDKNPWAPSVDRLDQTKGYTQDNVRLTCWAFNAARNIWSDEQFALVARAFLENYNGDG